MSEAANTEATVEVPAELVEQFAAKVRAQAKSYAEGAAKEAALWERWGNDGKTDGMGRADRVDVDRHLALSTAAMDIADQVGMPDGNPAAFTGSAWVLSDAAEALLVELCEEVKDVAFISPVEHKKVQRLTDRINLWAAECERIDSAGGEAVV